MGGVGEGRGFGGGAEVRLGGVGRFVELEPVHLPRAIAPGPSVVLAGADLVEFLRRNVVAPEVRAVVETVEGLGDRMPAEADGVAQPRRENLPPGTVRSGAQHGGGLGVRLAAVVAGRTGGDVEPAVGAHGQRAVGMLAGVRQVLDDGAGRRQRTVRGHVRHEHLLVGGDVQLAVMKRQAVSVGDVLCDHPLLVGGPVAVGIAQQ